MYSVVYNSLLFTFTLVTLTVLYKIALIQLAFVFMGTGRNIDNQMALNFLWGCKNVITSEGRVSSLIGDCRKIYFILRESPRVSC